MSKTLAPFQKQWQHYCLRLRLLESLKAFIAAGMLLAAIHWLGEPAFHWLVLLGQIALLLPLCGEWGRVHASKEQALRRLFLKEPLLAEGILATLDFQTGAPPSEQSAYFRARHLEALSRQLAVEKLARHVPLQLPLVWASAVILLLGGVIVVLPSLPFGLGAWLQQQDFFADERTYRILYPAYIRRPPFVEPTLPADLELPRGSRLEIFFPQGAISSAVKQGFYYQSEQGKEPLNWLSQKGAWVATLGPLHSGVLSMKWKGQRAEHRLAVVKDAPPKISVAWPSRPKIFSNSTLPLPLTATDDYGLRTIILYYKLSDKVLPDKALPDKEPYQETIQAFEGQFTIYEETYLWELGATPLRKGDRVQAWVEVSDNDAVYGPNVTLSEKFHFTVGDLKAYHEDIVERLQKIVTDLGALLAALDRRLLADTFEKEQAILKELEVLRNDAAYDVLLTEELHQFLFSELKLQILHYQQQRMALIPPS